MKHPSHKIVKYLFLITGTVCVGLGVIGIFFPVLPTTPFLLLAAFLYARSSERFLNWLLTNRCFGAYIRNYREGRGIPRREKILTITLLWITIIFSILYVVNSLWIKGLLLIIAVGVTIHLLTIKTYKPEAPSISSSVRPSPGETSGEV